MPDVGRNDPCPCGSGLKYKRCCARKREEEERQVRAAQAVGTTGMGLLTDFLVAKYGPRLRNEAWPRFAMDDRDMDAEDPEVSQLFFPWAMFHWRADGRPPARVWLDKADERREPDLKAWAEACLREPLTFLEVQSVSPGRGVEVKDLILDRQMFIHDSSLSQVARQWHVLLGKPVTVHEHTFLEGIGPTPFDPGFRNKSVDAMFASLRAERAKLQAGDSPLADELVVLGAYRRLVDAKRMPQPRKLQNTDGHPLVLCTSSYRVHDKRALADALRHLDGLELDEGAGRKRSWTWTKARNRLHAEWDNTVVGRVVENGASIGLETNSVERDADLRSRLDRACGDAIEYVSTDRKDATDPEVLQRLAPGLEGPEEPANESLRSEVERDIVASFVEKHYAAWMDTALPALEDRTPRQAARTKAGRERVEMMIRGFEFHQLPGAGAYDFDRIRRELGLLR
jgi:hypothetical protein